MKTAHRLLMVLTLLLTQPVFADSAIRPNDRIVFIGDSITGQGANHAKGWARLIGNALKTVHPDSNLRLVSLGGSGQGVGSWLSVEKKSRDASVILDVPGVDVKTELDQPADIVVCMLGVNDAGFPRISGSPESYEQWAGQYRELIRAIRARAKPRVFALATPTLLTEDVSSPKNRALAEMIARIKKIAEEENCLVLPTRETMEQILNEGRARKPDFHVTVDFVHPNPDGHVSIAAGMLKGLGENEAAQSLLDSFHAKFGPAPAFSYVLSYLGRAGESGPDRFRIEPKGGAASKAELSSPAGWTVRSEAGGFIVEGRPERLVNRLLLKSGPKVLAVEIPAPWLVGVGNIGRANGWNGSEFDPKTAFLPADADLSKGIGFGRNVELVPGRPVVWKRYFSSVNHAGGNAPGALDFTAVSFFQNFELGYGARWISSDLPRTASLRISPLLNCRLDHLVVWFNGTEVYSGNPRQAPAQSIPIAITAGKNSLVFKSYHYQGEWCFSVDLTGDESALDALKISADSPSGD